MSSRALYDRLSRGYDLISDASERPARIAGLRLLGLKPGESVLEIGCGTGSELLDLVALAGNEGRVLGLDVSSGMLDMARKKVADSGVDVRLIQGDARRLPFAGKSFDAVTMSFTLELFPEGQIGRVLREVRRVLRPKGRLGVVAMGKTPRGRRPGVAERAYVWLHRHFPHFIDCRPIDLDRLLEKARFRVIRHAELELWSMPVRAVVAV